METKNTLENKAKFFAQYWGQKILRFTQTDNSFSCLCVNDNINDVKNYSDWILELKALSGISDEDAIEVAKIGLGKSKLPQNIRITTTTSKYFGFSFILNNEHEYMIDFNNFYNPTLIRLSGKTPSNIYLHRVYLIVDYLRSNGYALPWNGITVEEMIEFGWIKLK